MKVELSKEKTAEVRKIIDETSENLEKEVKVFVGTFTGKDGITRTQYTIRIPKELAEEVKINKDSKFKFIVEIKENKKTLKGELIQ